jgi:hypothetical protein
MRLQIFIRMHMQIRVKPDLSRIMSKVRHTDYTGQRNQTEAK